MADHAGPSTPPGQGMYGCIVEELRACALQNLHLCNVSALSADYNVEDTPTCDVS
jgi:hypothetical protein